MQVNLYPHDFLLDSPLTVEYILKAMLKIGEFSQLSQVTVKTLHHYDEMGLLKPAHIDPFTNYRYYTVEQLPRVHRIMALKELGLSLEQIGLMLDEDMSTDQIRGMLRLKQAEAQQQMRETQRQLAMIEFRLRMIEAETNFPHLDVVVKQLEPMHYLSIFVPRPASQTAAMSHMKTTAQALKRAIADGTIKHTGATYDVFHGETILPFESPERSDRQHEIRLGVTEEQEAVILDGVGTFTVKEEPTVKTAFTLLLSDEDNSSISAAEKVTLMRRLSIAQGYQPYDLVRYFHLRGPLHTLNRDEFVLEAQLPVKSG
jgi:DNA-binding transcriptional MerR regulator